MGDRRKKEQLMNVAGNLSGAGEQISFLAQ